MGDRGARDRPTDRTQHGCQYALSVEISDCGDERAGRLAQRCGILAARVRAGSGGQKWKTGPRLYMDTPSSLEHPTTAQSQLVRVGGIRERSRPQLKCQELSSNKSREEWEEYHHQRAGKQEKQKPRHKQGEEAGGGGRVLRE